MDSQEEILDLLALYCEEKSKFLKPADAADDVSHIVEKETKGYEYMSKNFQNKLNKLRVQQHYKMRQTYMNGIVVVHKRKGPRLILFLCNYVRTPRGNVYFVKDDYDRSLTIFSGHFFDRLNERFFKKNLDSELTREELIAESLMMLQLSSSRLDREALLLDEDTGEAFHVFEDGYGAGEYLDVEADPEYFPANESGVIRVSFLKTFMTDEEVSPAKMDRMVELFRKSPVKEYQQVEAAL